MPVASFKKTRLCNQPQSLCLWLKQPETNPSIFCIRKEGLHGFSIDTAGHSDILCSQDLGQKSKP